MSLFNRVLSSVGIGAAKVDTLLQGERFCPGDMMNGVVRITGGNVEQRIDDIYFTVHCTYEVEHDDQKSEHTATLAHYKLSEGLTIAPGQERELPVALQLPWETPLTMGRTRVWVSTGLDIKQALDPGDNDYIQVVPGRLVSALLETLKALGFRLVEAETESAPPGFRRGLPFVQEFEFKAYSGPFRGRLDELELVCFPREGDVEVFLEVDRRARGLGGLLEEMMNRDETRLHFTLQPADLPTLEQQLRDTIARYS